MWPATLRTLVALAVVSSVSLPGRGATVTADAPTTGRAAESADALAVGSLVHSAKSLIAAPADVSSRAGRLVALCRFADKLKPADPRIHWLLVGIYEIQGRHDDTARLWRGWVAKNADDHSGAIRWLEAELTIRQSARARTDFIKTILGDAARPAPLRAEAKTRYGRILLGQGSKDRAREEFLGAIILDPHHRPALSEWLALQDKLAPADRADVMLRILKGNPLAADVAWELARMLDSLALHDQAIMFFDYAWLVARRQGSRQASYALAVQYFNAMLNAGRYDEAMRTFANTVDRFKQSTDLQTLMIEAHRRRKQTAQADRLVDAVQADYKKLQKTSPSAQLHGTLAWFYLVTLPKPGLALVYARKAHKAAPEDATIQRILAAVQLIQGDAAQKTKGEKQLLALQDSDIYAAAVLAEHYYAKGNREAGKRAILAGLALSRSGPAARKLLAIARSYRVVVAPAEGSERLAGVMRAAGREYLEMGRSPEKFLAVTIQAVHETLQAGQPIIVAATLSNISKADVSVGRGALLNPVISLRVTASSSGEELTFEGLSLGAWRARRYLKGGKSLTCKVRLDVGGLERFVSTRSLEELSLKVTGIVDPIVQDKKVRSSLPGIDVKPITITRASILGKFDRSKASEWPKAWQRMVAQLRSGVGSPSVGRRMLAARQVASLLGSLQSVESDKVKLVGAPAGFGKKQELFELVARLLRDSSATVRAEMLAALGQVKLEKNIVSLVDTLAADASPLVRFRLVERLGALRPTLVEKLVDDPNEMVRMMALAFKMPATTRPATTPATTRPATTPASAVGAPGP